MKKYLLLCSLVLAIFNGSNLFAEETEEETKAKEADKVVAEIRTEVLEEPSEFVKTLRKYDDTDMGISEMKSLVNAGINTKSKSEDSVGHTEAKTFRLNGHTALMIASRLGYTDLVEALIATGADINATNGSNTAVTFAIIDEDPKMLETLLKLGANPDISNNLALKYAIHYNYLDAAKTLLKYEANANIRGSFGGRDQDTGLIYAYKRGHLEMMKVLLDGGANIEEYDLTKDGGTPLIVIANIETTDESKRKLQMDAIDLLIKSGANINATTKTSLRTALMTATSSPLAVHTDEQLEMIKFLLKYKPLLEQKDKDGNTVLDLAYKSKASDMKDTVIDTLVDAGAVRAHDVK